MKRALILLLTLLLMVPMSVAVYAAPETPLVYFVTGVENQIDELLKTKIESFGFKVEMHSHEDYNVEDAKKSAVIYISESVSSANIANFFNDIAVPFISSEAYIADDMLITNLTQDTDFGVGTFTSVKVIKPDHPLVKDLPATFEIVKAEGATPTFQVVNEKNSVAVDPNDATRSFVLCYEKGDPAMDGSYNMPEKRIFINWHTTMFDGIYHDNMFTLLKNAFIYAVGFDPLAPEPTTEAIAETPVPEEAPAAAAKANPKTDDGIIVISAILALSCAAFLTIKKKRSL